MRRPRLNSAVATVAVETDLSLLRVASLSFVILFSLSLSSFRGAAQRRARNPLDRLRCDEMGSGLALRAPRNDNSIDGRLADRRAETGLKEVEVAAVIGLHDML